MQKLKSYFLIKQFQSQECHWVAIEEVLYKSHITLLYAGRFAEAADTSSRNTKEREIKQIDFYGLNWQERIRSLLEKERLILATTY